MLVHNKKRKHLCLKGLKEFDKEDTLISCQRRYFQKGRFIQGSPQAQKTEQASPTNLCDG